MDLIALHAERQPERPAIVEGDRVVTWRQFVELRNRLAHGLLHLGLRQGEHAVVYGHNSTEVLLAGAAIRAVGAIAVPMNHRLVPDEVAYILDDSEAVLAVVGEEFAGTAEAVRARARTVRRWVLAGVERRPWAEPLADLIASGQADPVGIDVGTNTGGSVIYTAGTSGRPKGARRRAVDPKSIIPRLEPFGLMDPSHVHLAAGPLYHSAPGAFALYTHVFGGTVVVLPRFDAEAALAAIARHRCTTTFMAPALLKRLADLPAGVRARYDVSSMRVIIVAAAPCPMAVKEAIVSWFGPVLWEFYGSTELGINTILRPEDVLRKPGSCGRAAPGIELAVHDDAGRPVPPGTPGELAVRRYDGVFDEYWKNPEATRETMRGEWLSVGDVAWIDGEGFVYICDRKRDMIISGGVNIYPAEVEDVLHRHPAVADVAVFGVPDDEWGERVHAAVQRRPGATAEAEELCAFARAQLAGFKVPRSVSFHDDFPRDAAGKLLKRVLREPYWAGRATRV
ncbi:MAG: AMP-binding protein [Candidatus Rokubacteria bacterium]|nr:AMP-binding protein [Candidatus Rokubacteria bacterium]